MPLPGDMIKPHTTAKLQQTNLLGVRGEAKVNLKTRRKKVRVTTEITKGRKERKRGHREGKNV